MRPTRSTLALAAAAAVLASTPASAAVVRAESVLPPGQSGFVSATGLANGTGSPHLYDQIPLFVGFKRKPMTFGQPGTTESPRDGVTIVRDTYGVPAVTGATAYDAWWGAGYAVAEDRLFELEAFRRATTGHLAEVVGKGMLQSDYIARRDYYTPAERAEMFQALPGDIQARFEAYRDGVNAWIAHVRLNPLDLPGEFPAVLALPIRDWTVDDSIAVGIFLARTVPSGDGRELENLQALRELGPKGFDKLLPHSAPGQKTTVPKANGRFPSQPGATKRSLKSAYKRSQRFAAGLPIPKADDPTQVVAPGALAAKAALPRGFEQLTGQRRGSYMAAVRGKDGHAYLFNGPQLGFAVPELFVELEVHAPGLDLHTATAPGVPVGGVGHNGTVAWGFTSGLSDEDDLFAEKLVPGQPEKYYFKGEVRTMDCRDETISYRSPPTDLLGGATPESGSVVKRICRTVHGPVQARAGDVAYARQYAIWKRDVETIVGLAKVDDAKTIQEVDAALQDVTWNENLMAIDSAGNIGFWHPGLHPLRSRRYDERLPFPGTGEAEWRGLIDRRRTPHVINPKQGWLANWNNPASAGWMMGDAEATEKLAGPFHRSAWLFKLAARAHGAPSWEAMEQLVRDAGTRAQQRPLAAGRLKQARRRAKGSARALLDALLAWDGSYTRVDDKNTVDPGVAIWEEFKDQAERIALDRLRQPQDLGPGVKTLAGSTGNSHMFDISNGEAYGLRTLDAAGYRDAAQRTFTALTKRYETSEISRWREPRRLYKVSAQGAGSVDNFPFFDRGTFEQLIETAP